MTVAVLVEKRDGVVTPPTLEVLTVARNLGEVIALWFGEGPDEDAVAQLAAYGVSEVRVTDIGDQIRLAASAAAAIAEIAADAKILLFTSNFINKEIATRLAVITGAGMVVDAAGADLVSGQVETDQTVFAATWNIRSRIRTETAIVGLRPNTTVAEPAVTPGAARIVRGEVDLPATREQIVEITQVPPPEGVPLAEAPVVVSGGRGTGGDYQLVREFAELLGGAVGASRDATDEGWISHDHMVGQTGTTVTPALYVACGISGAVHHRGGMQASGTIVAINIDPDAPIFEIADFGVVGDLFEVLPQAIQRIKAHRGEYSV